MLSSKNENAYKKINEIFVSGWNRYIDQYSRNNYFISYLISNLKFAL